MINLKFLSEKLVLIGMQLSDMNKFESNDEMIFLQAS